MNKLNNTYSVKDWMDHHTNTICHAMTYQTYGIDFDEPKDKNWSTREGEACREVMAVINKHIDHGATPPSILVEELRQRLATFDELKERGL